MRDAFAGIDDELIPEVLENVNETLIITLPAHVVNNREYAANPERVDTSREFMYGDLLPLVLDSETGFNLTVHHDSLGNKLVIIINQEREEAEVPLIDDVVDRIIEVINKNKESIKEIIDEMKTCENPQFGM